MEKFEIENQNLQELDSNQLRQIEGGKWVWTQKILGAIEWWIWEVVLS